MSRVPFLRQKTVVLCGSMRNLDVMLDVADRLRQAGIRVVVPRPDDPGDTPEQQRRTKRAASRLHMDHILRRGTTVLVVNADLPGRPNYVGPSAFAEIAVAFALRRPVYLLQDIPEHYADELAAWDVVALAGHLDPLVRVLSRRAVHQSR